MNHTSKSSYLLSVEVDYFDFVTFGFFETLKLADSILTLMSGGFNLILLGFLIGVRWKDFDVCGGATIDYSLIASVDCYSYILYLGLLFKSI